MDVNEHYSVLLGVGDECEVSKVELDVESVNRLCVPLCTATANNEPLLSGVLFYQESQRDGNLSRQWKSRISVHELGHNFGLYDLQNSPASDGIMYAYAPVGRASVHYFWRAADIDTIRNKTKPK